MEILVIFGCLVVIVFLVLLLARALSQTQLPKDPIDNVVSSNGYRLGGYKK